ncbi:MAG: hypothetical protein ABW123_06905 [Cystobacter sp.]
MASSHAPPADTADKKIVKETRKRLASQGVKLQTGSPTRIVVKKKRPFLFSS